MRLSDVQHQPRALALLRRGLHSGRTPHAYLFEGPEGVGKELTARALAARLLCLDERLAADADACGRCAACRLVESDNHPDLHLVHRGLHKLHPDPRIRRGKALFLVVDVVRHFLIEPAALKPSQGRRRVFIVRDAERMNEQAQNALLKTLEEPPGTACLILLTSSAGRLLPTIRSRCQSVPFGLLPAEFVAHELRARTDLSAADARTLAHLSEGRLGVALRWQQLGLLELWPAAAELVLVPDQDIVAFGKGTLELASTLAARAAQAERARAEEPDEDEEEEREEDDDDEEDEGPGRRAATRRIATDELRAALKLVLMLQAALLRDGLLLRTGAAAPPYAPQQHETAAALARQPTGRLERALEALHEAEYLLDRNVAPQLTCERLAVALLGELPP